MVDRDIYSFIVRPDSITVWNDNEVRRRLDWYYNVMKGLRPPKYIISKYIGIPHDLDKLEGYTIEELMGIHRDVRRDFMDLYRDVRKGFKLEELERPRESFLDLKTYIAYKLLRRCGLCEWNCKVDRYNGRRGVCGLGREAYVASAFLHYGEEAPLVPSGTIFFSGCSLKCVFCQNWDISQRAGEGIEVSPELLADIAIRLGNNGARNINYVGGNPDQNIHVIIDSLRHMDIWIPILWNSNMYMTVNALELLLDIVDIWLPDFKWWVEEHAFRYSRIKRYREVVSRNLKIVYDYGSDIIIRHLVMPGHVECCTIPILDWIAENTPNVLVNIMDQYRPEYKASYDERFRDIARRITIGEYRKATEHARKLNIVFEPVS